MFKKIFFMIIGLSMFFSSLVCHVSQRTCAQQKLQEVVEKLSAYDIMHINEMAEQFSLDDRAMLEQVVSEKTTGLSSGIDIVILIVVGIGVFLIECFSDPDRNNSDPEPLRFYSY